MVTFLGHLKASVVTFFAGVSHVKGFVVITFGCVKALLLIITILMFYGWSLLPFRPITS